MKKYNFLFPSFCNFSCILLFTFVLMLFAGSKTAQYLAVSTDNVHSKNLPMVVIDPGHGGTDPGKVSASGTLEKDINLAIALRLKKLLEAQDVDVIMTRETDTELTDATIGRKLSDMKERISFIEEKQPVLVISIHQNSYPDASVYGAQCFYYTNSKEGQTLANLLQKQIIASTNQTKIREIKENNDYYLLKKSPATTVIVECGFLSSPEEEALLKSADYQENMAWAIHLGILQYLNL